MRILLLCFLHLNLFICMSVYLCGLDLSLLFCLSWWESSHMQRERGDHSWQRTEWTWSWRGWTRQIRHTESEENLENILPKHFYPYCECREDREWGENLRRGKHRPALVPNQWTLESMEPSQKLRSPFLLPDHHACQDVHQHREVLLDAGCVGVTALDLVHGLHRGRGVGAVLRNVDLLEHMIASHSHDEDDDNINPEMEDYYENHKAWPTKPRK